MARTAQEAPQMVLKCGCSVTHLVSTPSGLTDGDRIYTYCEDGRQLHVEERRLYTTEKQPAFEAMSEHFIEARRASKLPAEEAEWCGCVITALGRYIPGCEVGKQLTYNLYQANLHWLPVWHAYTLHVELNSQEAARLRQRINTMAWVNEQLDWLLAAVPEATDRFADHLKRSRAVAKA